MTAPLHDNPEDSLGVKVALDAWSDALATGGGPRAAMLAALRSVAALMKEEIAGEAAVITMETVLEAVDGELKRWQALKDWLGSLQFAMYPQDVLKKMRELEEGK